MRERRVNVGFVGFPYGGNGGVPSEVPDIKRWLIPTVAKCKADPRIDEIHSRDIAETPITMARNEAVCWARESGVDVLCMYDSDMCPDVEVGEDSSAKPFWDESFTFIFDRWDQGPHVVCAPYCGPPPYENVYVFHWGNYETGSPDVGERLESYTREHAAILTGIQPVAAQPTGLILFDMRAFNLTEPKTILEKPWFYYEYSDRFEYSKSSTEDVTATRDMHLVGHRQLGREVLFCHWDAWCGHWKKKLVRKPRPVFGDKVQLKYANAVREDRQSNMKIRFIGDPATRLGEEKEGSAHDNGKAGEHSAKVIT